jgi:hypothetical protein
MKVPVHRKLLLGMMVFLTGCSSNTDLSVDRFSLPSSNVIREMAGLGIIPIFPPNSNVRVGDIRLILNPPLKEEQEKTINGISKLSDKQKANFKLATLGGIEVGNIFTNSPSHLESSGLIDRLHTYEESRGYFTNCAGTRLSTISAEEFPEDEGTPICLRSDLGQKKEVVLSPLLTTKNEFAALQQFSAGGGFMHSVGKILGFVSSEDETDVSISLQQVYVSKLPANELGEMAKSKVNGGFVNLCGVGDMAKILAMKSEPEKEVPFAFLVVQQVFYAKGITYSFKTGQRAGAGLDAFIKQQEEINNAVAQTSETDAPSPQSEENSTEEEDKKALQQAEKARQAFAEKLEQLEEKISTAFPSASVRYASVNEGAVTADVTFREPVAIGYRAISLSCKGTTIDYVTVDRTNIYKALLGL